MKALLRPGNLLSVLVGAALTFALLASGIAREVPIGSIEGAVTMAENGRPLGGAALVFRPQFQVEGAPRVREFYVKADGVFTIRSMPAGEYTVEAFAKAHSLKQTRVVVAEGRPTVLDLAMEPTAPFLDLNANQHVFTPNESSSFLISGFTEGASVSVSIYKAKPAQIAQAGGLNDVFQPLSSYSQNANKALAAFGSPVKAFEHKIENRDAEGVFNDFLVVPPMPNGVYWVECRVGASRKGAYLNVTRIAMVTKYVKGRTLSFVSNIRTGTPVAGAVISEARSGAFAKVAVTGADGTASFSPPASRQDREVVLSATYGDDVAFVDFYNSSRSGDGAYRIFTYTERPVYRPGDTAMFKGIVRRHKGNGYALPEAGEVEVKLQSYDGNVLDNQTIPLSDQGSFDGKFSLNKELEPGSYQMVSRFGDTEETADVQVSAYRKPEFTVKVTPNQKFYVRGDTAKATIKCEYYFGGPVVGAKVSVTVSRSPYWWSGEDAEFVNDEGYSDGGEYLTQVAAVTDGRGEATIEFATREPNDPDRAETDFLYSISASVEEGDKYFDGSASVRVTRGQFGLQVEAQKYIVAPSERFNAKIVAKWNGDDKPAAGRPVRLILGHYVWTNRTSDFVTDSSMSATTGSDGTVAVPLSWDRGGELVMRAIATDDRGNEIVSETQVWVDRSGIEQYAQPPPEMSIRLDKKVYVPGDRLRALIRTAKKGGSALVTVQGADIYASKVVPLNGPATVVELPVRAEYAPNAFVSVAYVQDKKFFEASERLVVNDVSRRLGVAIEADKQAYQPGDLATYTITTTRSDGSPVPAEVSLAVVDESIYAIAPDYTNILAGFYPQRYDAVSTAYSFPELYLDGGDKTPADIKVRSKFLDTAFWQPSVRTDSQGRATVTVQLPDNLTAWRATAIGVTDQTEVGQATMLVRARKDLMIRLQPPSFLVRGDEQTLTATVVNDTGQAADVNVELLAEGASFQGDKRSVIRVEPGKPATLEWSMRPSSASQATLTAKAWINGGASDGVRQTAPIRPHGRARTVMQAGVVQGAEEINLQILPASDRVTGGLALTFSPSLAVSLAQSAEALIAYPYGCVEQTMSRFMPAVLTAQTMRTLGLRFPKAEDLPRIAAESYQRLKNMEQSDGGWGWWQNDAPDPYMTTYVLEGVFWATKSGFPNKALDIEAAIKWAKAELKRGWKKEQEEMIRTSRLYLAYAIALHGASQESLAFLRTIKGRELSAVEEALYALTMEAAGDRAESLASLDRLILKANQSAETAYWPGEDTGYYGSFYGFEVTGRALQAIMAIRPDDPIATKVVTYLTLSRKGDMWTSTRDTAVLLVGLNQYLAKFPSPIKDSVVTVSLNGRMIRRLSLTRASQLSPETRIELPISELNVGPNALRITSAGGRPIYSLTLKQTIVQDRLGQLVSGSGISIQREYYGLEPRRTQDGTMRLMTTREAISQIESGSPVRVALTIRSERAQEFIMIEDPIPSNTRIMDRGEGSENEDWAWWYTAMKAYDDRMVIFARTLPKGLSRITYTIRAESPGTGHAMPAALTNMYDPSIGASSGETVLEVTRR